MTAIRQKDIADYILKLLAPVDNVDNEIFKFVGAIAVDVLDGKKALQRDTDPPRLMGMIINATWKNGKERGRKPIMEALEKAIKSNKYLKESKKSEDTDSQS